jgi:hypothetical protein
MIQGGKVRIDNMAREWGLSRVLRGRDAVTYPPDPLPLDIGEGKGEIKKRG